MSLVFPFSFLIPLAKSTSTNIFSFFLAATIHFFNSFSQSISFSSSNLPNTSTNRVKCSFSFVTALNFSSSFNPMANPFLSLFVYTQTSNSLCFLMVLINQSCYLSLFLSSQQLFKHRGHNNY
jgi:hypothetical protein